MYAMRSFLPSFGALGGAVGLPQQLGSATPGAVSAAFPQFVAPQTYPRLGTAMPDWASLLMRIAAETPQGPAIPPPPDPGGDYNWQGHGP